MRHALAAISSIIIVMVFVFGSLFVSSPEPATAGPDPVVSCQVVVQNPARIVCTAAGVQVLNTVVQLPTVTLPPVTVTAPGATITLPPRTVTLPASPQATRTIEVPGPTQTATATVTAPGSNSTATVTLPAKPGPTVTLTARPSGTSAPVPTKTKTITAPVETVTLTPSVSPSGQKDPERGTLDSDDDFVSPDVDLGDGNITIVEAGLGALSLIALAFVGLLAVYGGYRMGRKSAADEDTDFLRTLLDNVKSNR